MQSGKNNDYNRPSIKHTVYNTIHILETQYRYNVVTAVCIHVCTVSCTVHIIPV